ncbi:hypothetical protein HCN44_010438 [Aphidius gifuensis]|uniref:Cytochrome P450 n=1 Tax=Aphidius gifuensis TaxID=684658 RepID=A0A835CPV2_APHGI|nr:hypothetical protein HCN44_010438 [Aphidius gifuensis]
MLSVILVGFCLVVYYYLICNYNYWKNKRVPGPKPCLLFGNTKDPTLLKLTIGESLMNIYQAYDGSPFVGIYEMRSPVLLLRDPDLIKQVLIKDFSHFQGRGIVMNESNDPLCANIVNLSGPRWRVLRTKLSPAFTSSKIHKMFDLIIESSNKYKKFVEKYADNNEAVEFRDLSAKFATDVISSCCFGLETNSIQNIDSEFRKICKHVLDPSMSISFKRIIRWYMPWVFSRLKITMTPLIVTNYFMKIVKEIIKHRETNNLYRHDMMQLLIQLKNKEKIKEDIGDTINEEMIAAQAYIFFLAGYETSSTTMSFAMYEISKNPKIQQRLVNEIDDVIAKHGSMTYQAILEMEYLDCVIRETLRMHTPVGVTPRICNKPYKIPGTDVVIEKGIKVLIPIHAIHHDPNIYPNPSTFNPDRFENKKLRDNCTFLPFGEGPRICIGIKFAFAQIKAGLVTILQNYEIFPSDKMNLKIKYDPTANILTASSGIWINIRRRSIVE